MFLSDFCVFISEFLCFNLVFTVLFDFYVFCWICVFLGRIFVFFVGFWCYLSGASLVIWGISCNLGHLL